MKKTAIYSRAARPASPTARAVGTNVYAVDAHARNPEDDPHGTSPGLCRGPASRPRGLHRRLSRWGLPGAVLAGLAMVALSLHRLTPAPAADRLSPATLQALNAEVRRSLSQHPLPSATTQAYERIAPSVVRVSGGESSAASSPEGVGTGVVIIDNGTILTNHHVVQRAKRIKVMFHDGQESPAEVVSVDPANDLAVLRAKHIPDDLRAATLRSTADLRPGDAVLTVGFPFGIGPSVTSGVVSGLQREYRSPDGQQTISNLIQFDAAANPGNSGGPLLNLEGEVVGIVTAILNPGQQRVFIGIGFAVPIENAAAGAGTPPF